jgi:hypothetical protein
MENGAEVEFIICPSCGEDGPRTKFCLNCGAEMVIESENMYEESEEPITEEEITVTSYRENPPTNVKRSKYKVHSINENDLDPVVKESMSDLKKSVDLILWLVDKFLKGNVEEEHFLKVFESYEYRFDQGLKRRTQMLDSAQDLKPLQKGLNEAMLFLSELERRKIIGDISDEEYNLKAPVYRWDIDKFEKEIEKRKADITVLENLVQIMTENEISEMTTLAENAREEVKEQIQAGTFSEETGQRIQSALDNTLSAFESIKSM